jgi:hypothetical protein
MQRIIAYLLIVSLISANFSRLFVYAGFELNKNYGKCYFMKKIKQAEDKQNSENRQAQKNLFQEAFYSRPAVIKFHSVLLSVIAAPNYRIKLPEQSRSVFQPPRVS